jgi:plasmanylethanolamine desaturase
MGTFLICLIIADFLTGFFHWLEDTYGVPNMPFVGKAIIEPNIDHHRNPSLIGSMGSFLNRNYQTVLIAMGVCGLLYVVGLFRWEVLLTLAISSFGNEVHSWNHRPHNKNNVVVRFLSDSGLIQSRLQHNRHHKAPYDKNFCVLTNFTNSVLEIINFWKGLEWTILKVFKIPVKRMSEARDGY